MKTLTKSDINLKNWKFEFQQRNKNCILMADCHTRGLYNNFAAELRFDIPKYDYIFTNSDRGYIKLDKKAEVLKKLRKAIENDEYLAYVIKNSIDQIKEYSKVVDSINTEIKDELISNEKLSKLWTQSDQAYQKMQPWFYIPWYISEENMVTDRVKDELARHVKEIEKITDLQDALGLLIFPTKKVAFQKEQEDFFDLVALAEKNPDF